MASLMDQAEQIAQKNQMTPVTQDYDESKGVAGRVASITSEDSPLMRQAATTGAQSAAARGLTNSSLAGQASQQAVISSATPIATADASLFSSQSLANQQAKNAAASQNAQTGATLGNTALVQENANQQQAKSLAQQAEQFKVSSGQTQQQIDAQIDQFAKQLGMTAADLQLRREQLSQADKQFLDNLNLQKQQLAQQQGQFDVSQQANQANFAAELAQRQQQFEAQQTQQSVLAKADNDLRVKLAEIEAKSRQTISSNDTVANAWGSMMQNISNIQNNANLEEAAKRTLIDNQVAAFQSYTNFWQKLTGGTIDVTDLLKFGAASGPNGSTLPAPAKPADDLLRGTPREDMLGD